MNSWLGSWMESWSMSLISIFSRLNLIIDYYFIYWSKFGFIHADKFPSSLWGPTCDSLDCVRFLLQSWNDFSLTWNDVFNPNGWIELWKCVQLFLLQILKSVMLPRLNLGDYVIFENMGAYTITVACQFNGFQMPKVEYYIERRHL